MKKSFFSLYSNFILNLHIVYELNNWLRNSINNFPLQIYFSGTTKLVRTIIKVNLPVVVEEKHLIEKVHGVYVTIFGVDDGSSSHTDNKKTTF